ncbi:hypothetical protein GGS26DRAFT_95484 [Hypomontagnella submonticulosa]|nr:hypothetical protein GGS26DRAFT_95484 [Hypomontagnella submonticulosa]
MQLTTGPAYNGNPLYPQGLYTHAHFEAPNHSARPTSVTQHKSAASPRVRNPTPRQTDPTRRRTKPTQARTKPAPTSQQPEPRKSPEAPKSVKSVEPPEPPEPPKPVEPVEPVQPVPTTVPLPFGLDQLQAATQRLDAEAKQREELEKKLADTAANSQRQDFLWPGDTSAYPAEVFADVDFPESEFRARTIHMGNPKNDARPATGVYAVQKTLGGRIEYRIARDGCPVDWVDKAPEVQYGEISLNVFFAGMRQAQAEIWIRQMLATVPGRDDTLVKWHRAGPGPPQPEAKGRWAWVSE